MRIFRRPQSPKDAQQIAPYILNMTLHLTERYLLRFNEWTLRFLAGRFANAHNLGHLPEWKRGTAKVLCFIGNLSLLVALGHLLADQYNGLVGIPIALVFYLLTVVVLR